MPQAPRRFILVCIALVLVGCDKRHSIGGGYEVVQQAEGFGSDGHPGVSLAFKGKEVWPNVDVHTFIYQQDASRFVHGNICVFLISLPDNDKVHLRYEISPQLCAIRGSGPPMVLSERILDHVINNFGDGVVIKLVPSDAGVHVEFGGDADEEKATSTHDISWEQVAAWLDSPESAAPTIVKPLGTYRLLPPLTPASQPHHRKQKPL